MDKKVIHTDNAPQPIGPYSQAVVANGSIYVSGQIAIEPASGDLITDDITSETHQVMRNIEAILSEANITFTNVVKCSIFIKNMKDFPTINEAYGSYFKENPPARETVEVSGLPKGVNVEISCIASM